MDPYNRPPESYNRPPIPEPISRALPEHYGHSPLDPRNVRTGEPRMLPGQSRGTTLQQEYHQPKTAAGPFIGPETRKHLTFEAQEAEEEKAEQNLEPYDHSFQTPTYFYVMINGQVEFGDFRDFDGICVKLDFVAGIDWTFVENSGSVSGISQHSFKSGGLNKRIVWNFPFELTYRSLNPHGWPQLVLTCSAKDYLGREINYAYGCVHVPTQPGRHERYVRMFSPVSSSALTRFFAWITGRYAEYFNATNLIAKAEGREVTRVKSGGIVKIVFQVSHRNMEAFGFFC